jgi:hypothetical protein
MQQVPELKVLPAEAERAISHALTTGNNFNFSGWSGAQFAITSERLDRWYQDVDETLRGLFTTPEMAQQFMAVSHDITSVEEGDERYLPVRQTFDHRMAWLRRLQENLSIYAPTPALARQTQSKVDFDEITVRWLIDHLPTKKWVILFGILVAIFLGGTTVGQTTFVRELLGKKPETAQVTPKLTSQEFKDKVDQLIQGHNTRREDLTKAIIDQQRGAALSTTGYSERQKAIAELHKDMENEDTTFQSDLKALQSLTSQK